MKNKVVFFLDKEFPPKHSFVDGFICNENFKREISPIIAVTKRSGGKKTARYRGCVSWLGLSQRKGISRALRFFESIFFIKAIKSSEKINTVFIRNDPLILAAMVLLKHSGVIKKIIYQNSFPHEVNSGLTGKIAKLILKNTLKHVDLVLVVANHAMSRILSYSPSSKIVVVPLLVQDDMFQAAPIKAPKDEIVKFVYIGTLAEVRRIDFIIEAFSALSRSTKKFTFDLIGGEPHEIEKLKELEATKLLSSTGSIKFHGKVDRELISKLLPNYHVGVSIIPPTKMYIESSPTKLGEYLSNGIPVLVSNGIPYQDSIAKKTTACKTANYSKEDLASAALELILNPESIEIMSSEALVFSRENLSYAKKINTLMPEFK